MKQIQAHEYAVLSAVYNRGKERLETLGSAAGLSADSLYIDVETMFDEADLDAVVNCLPNKMHSSISIQALEAGLHVLCEKPIALSVEEVDAIAGAAKTQGRVVAEAFMYRHHPQTLKVQELVQSGSLGTLKLAQDRMAFVMGASPA